MESALEYLTRRHGAHPLERLGGLSGQQVYRVRSERGDALLNTDISPNEARFYLHHAEFLRQAGVGVPLLEAHGQDEGGLWLLLEWIPQPLPPERWLAERYAEDFARAAEVYVHLLGRSIKKTTPLRLAAVTAWTAVELLSALRGDEHAELANRLTAALPSWLEAVLPKPS